MSEEWDELEPILADIRSLAFILTELLEFSGNERIEAASFAAGELLDRARRANEAYQEVYAEVRGVLHKETSTGTAVGNEFPAGEDEPKVRVEGL